MAQLFKVLLASFTTELLLSEQGQFVVIKLLKSQCFLTKWSAVEPFLFTSLLKA